MDLHHLIKELLPAGRYIYGFADMTGLLNRKYRAYPCALSIGRVLDGAVIDELAVNGPTRRYYDHYRSVNEELARTLDTLSDALGAIGIGSVKIHPTFEESELDRDFSATLISDFSHKMAATRAGLGWIGKTDLFVSRTHGPRVRLATLLTDHPLPETGPSCDESRCGACTACVDACPAKAASGMPWSIHTEREEFFDAFKCRDKCRELAARNINIELSICGICISVCPIGRRT